MLKDTLFSCLVALIASLFCTWLLFPLAKKIGLVDRPNQRKLHQDNVPLIGGIVIFFGFCLALLQLHISLQPYRGLLSGGVLLVLMGVLDDFKDLSARLRLVGQVLVALTLTSWGGLQLENLGDLVGLGAIHLHLWALPITVLLVMTQLNAMNMIDGQDGLAGGVATGQLLWLWLYADRLSLVVLQVLMAILGVLLAVFLSFNMRLPWRKRAMIFLGDAGSTFLAFVLIWAAIQVSQTNPAVVRPVDLLWVMALPVLDLLNVMFYRLRQRVPVTQAGRDHAHHALLHVGLTPAASTLGLLALSMVLGMVGFALSQWQIHEYISFALFIGVAGCCLYLFDWARRPTNQGLLTKANRAAAHSSAS